MEPKTRRLTTREKAEINRTRAEVAALAALAFLWWQRREAGLVALAGSMTPRDLSLEARRMALGTIGSVRERSAEVGIKSARRQLPTLAIALPAVATLRGFRSASATASSYSQDWGAAMRQALGTGQGPAEAAASASQELATRAESIARTEASQAHSLARRQAVRAAAAKSDLVALERWVTEFGPNTCHICTLADGETVRLGEDFASGIPGAVHPRCHCTSIYVYETPEATWLLTV